jgi:hypothetical protein
MVKKKTFLTTIETIIKQFGSCFGLCLALHDKTQYTHIVRKYKLTLAAKQA